MRLKRVYGQVSLGGGEEFGGAVFGQLFQELPEHGAKGGDRGARRPSHNDPRVASSVTMQRLGGVKLAPMKRQMLGCRRVERILTSALNSSKSCVKGASKATTEGVWLVIIQRGVWKIYLNILTSSLIVSVWQLLVKTLTATGVFL
jgi:hypothetical protein